MQTATKSFLLQMTIKQLEEIIKKAHRKDCEQVAIRCDRHFSDQGAVGYIATELFLSEEELQDGASPDDIENSPPMEMWGIWDDSVDGDAGPHEFIPE